MIRTFTFSVDNDDKGYEITAIVTVDDSEYGFRLEVEGKTYRFDNKAVVNLKEILDQIEIKPSN